MVFLWFSYVFLGSSLAPPSAPARQDRGLTEDEVRAYLLHRVTPQRLELEASMEVRTHGGFGAVVW